MEITVVERQWQSVEKLEIGRKTKKKQKKKNQSINELQLPKYLN